MPAGRDTVPRRFVIAFDVLRGRRPRFDYGLLLVTPFVAAAGGALISAVVETAIERRRATVRGSGNPFDNHTVRSMT
jgi:hypothetical protein